MDRVARVHAARVVTAAYGGLQGVEADSGGRRRGGERKMVGGGDAWRG